MARSSRRYYRTVLLGVAALGAMVWFAVDQFDIPWQDMRDLLLATLLVIGVVIAVAALGTAAWIGLRKLLRGRDET
ncbi:hypothetical protein E4634_04330 [Mangrovimicrobium sediminis]|uniref:Uncharacterized protein n=1 Tax=Mangrovimicrobium sediminis TaxID=2562682 RepID=A0A4Z0M6C9_9GAMM|nr:hypothetical protein [Haliea sp. SAOS-164]TGD75232.1 hypothetical protein E4634_04330 [Haliea sp. SAOS-164]